MLVKALVLPVSHKIQQQTSQLGAMLPASNVTARQRGRRSSGVLRLAAVVLLVALLALCLARAGAAASLSSPAGRAPASEKVVESESLENNARGQEVERGHYTTLAAAAAAEDDDDGPAVPERVELEVIIEDYTPSGPNNRHQPHP